jgi:hypothetical protein
MRQDRTVLWRMTRVIVAYVIFIVVSTATPARANCIAHQPPNARFIAPPGLQMTWECVTGGPLYDHERDWFIITFKATNTDTRRVQAMKLQANVVDAFGDVLRTVPIVENARLGTGDSDGAVWAFRPTVDTNSIDHVAFYVLAVKYESGPVWTYPGPSPRSGPTPSPRAKLQRFSIGGLNYDMGGVIAPSPSPSPTSTPH